MTTPGTRIDELPAGATFAGTETIPGMTGGVAYRWTLAQFATYVRANLGTVTSGVWNGTPISVQYGGTGLTGVGSGGVLVGSSGTSYSVQTGVAGQIFAVSEQTDLPVFVNPYIPQVAKSANYTFALTDGGKHFLHPSADTSARTWTIPANSSVAYPVGTTLTLINQNSAGVLTIAITTDTMRLSPDGTAGSRTLAANGVATAIKITTTEWIIAGSGLT